MNTYKVYFAGWKSMVGTFLSLKGKAVGTRVIGGEIPLQGKDVEPLYQAFKARGEAEAKEKLTEIFGPVGCRCPYPYEATRDDGICRYLGDTDACTHPSNKPPEPESEPECEHKDGLGCSFKYYTVYGKIPGENFPYIHCPLCGKTLR